METDESGVEWGDWTHAEREVSIELLYARLACGCHGHLAAERRGVPGSFLMSSERIVK